MDPQVVFDMEAPGPLCNEVRTTTLTVIPCDQREPKGTRSSCSYLRCPR